jgi:hypothetical protein
MAAAVMAVGRVVAAAQDVHGCRRQLRTRPCDRVVRVVLELHEWHHQSRIQAWACSAEVVAAVLHRPHLLDIFRSEEAADRHMGRRLRISRSAGAEEGGRLHRSPIFRSVRPPPLRPPPAHRPLTFRGRLLTAAADGHTTVGRTAIQVSVWDSAEVATGALGLPLRKSSTSRPSARPECISRDWTTVRSSAFPRALPAISLSRWRTGHGRASPSPRSS